MSTSAAVICLIVGITDGDTLTAKCPTETIKIRLAEIDAPEKKQPFGAKSKESLSDLCFDREAKIFAQSKDRYQRTLAKVECQGRDAGAHQITHGMAWVFDRYVKDRSLYEVQADAQYRHAGLWSQADAIAPWDWRKQRKSKKT